MKLKIEIEMENEAFFHNGEPTRESEVSKILHQFIHNKTDEDFDLVGNTWILFDSNGNRVGYAKVMNERISNV